MHPKVKKLLLKPQLKQKSPEWFSARKVKITASEVASCLINNNQNCDNYIEQISMFFKESFYNTSNIDINGWTTNHSKNSSYEEALNIFLKKIKLDNKCSNPYKSLNQFIIDKCSPILEYKDTITTLWGKQYEDIACRFYSLLTKEHINEFGLVNHYRNKWLAASPDGITDNGIMLEIKCPLKRSIVDCYIPFYYYVQTQIQLECCNLDTCHYLECKIEEIEKDNFWNKEENLSIYDGILIKDLRLNSYIYPPNDILTKTEYRNWIESFEYNNPANFQIIYFNITKYQLLTIPRSTEWFNKIKISLKENWDTIQLFQNDEKLLYAYKDKYYTNLYRENTLHWNNSELNESLIPTEEEQSFLMSDVESNDSNSDIDMEITESVFYL